MPKARYIMIGGFLGAGKTTSILRLAEHLRDRGRRVGLITNDQSVGLVDTAMLASHGFPVQEITGGCFCCRFNSLVDAADKLATDARPDVFIAEPVGSCTDLKASVSYPLRRMYGDNFSIAPLSVLVDPIRAMRILNVEPAGKAFSPKVVYVYGKQLEEAESIVVNKVDLLDDRRRAKLRAALAAAYPKARIFEVSARDGSGLEAWFDHVAADEMVGGRSMPIDYDLYAEGEALLGWMNCTVTVSGPEPIDGNALIRDLAGDIHDALKRWHMEVAHLKMTLTPGDGGSDIAVVNVVRNDAVPELSHELAAPITRGELIINLRAEAAPKALSALTEQSIAVSVFERRPGWDYKIDHMEAFRPGKPEPTYRIEGEEVVA